MLEWWYITTVVWTQDHLDVAMSNPMPQIPPHKLQTSVAVLWKSLKNISLKLHLSLLKFVHIISYDSETEHIGIKDIRLRYSVSTHRSTNILHKLGAIIVQLPMHILYEKLISLINIVLIERFRNVFKDSFIDVNTMQNIYFR